jgi:hypothetical protein
MQAKKKKSQYREGYLNQRGKISKAWSKRWFVLKTSVLFYYKVRGDNQPAGTCSPTPLPLVAASGSPS